MIGKIGWVIDSVVRGCATRTVGAVVSDSMSVSCSVVSITKGFVEGMIAPARGCDTVDSSSDVTDVTLECEVFVVANTEMVDFASFVKAVILRMGPSVGSESEAVLATLLCNGHFVQCKTGIDDLKKVDISIGTYNSSQSEVLTADCDAKIEKALDFIVL